VLIGVLYAARAHAQAVPAAAPPVAVQQPAPQRWSHLFLTGDLGLATHSCYRDWTGNGIGRITGAGVNLRAAGGVRVGPRLALFAGVSLFESAAVSIQQGSLSEQSDQDTLTAASLFLGGRLYLPSDVYLEGTLGTLQNDETDHRSDTGYTSDNGMIGQV